jgi:O-antigen ligase
LQILADGGIAGFACVAAFIFLLFKRGLKTIGNATDSFQRNVAIGALAGCFGILIHSFFDFPLRTTSNAFFFLTLAALATVPITSQKLSRKRK